MSTTEQSKSILDLAIQAHKNGLDTPERVVTRLESIIARNARYVDRRVAGKYNTSFDDVVREDNGAIAAAIVLIESQMGNDANWLRRYTEHVVRYAIRFSEDNDEQGIQAIIDGLPPMKTEN